MTLHDVGRISRHWQKNPPLRTLVAACAAALGVKLENLIGDSNKPKPMTYEEFQAMVKRTGGKIPGVGSM